MWEACGLSGPGPGELALRRICFHFGGGVGTWFQARVRGAHAFPSATLQERKLVPYFDSEENVSKQFATLENKRCAF